MAMYQTRADARDDALAQRVAGLHHAVGDAAGEVVLEERPALPHHVPVALPADEARHARHHGVVAHQAVGSSASGRPMSTSSAMPSSIGSAAWNAARAVGGLHQRDELADEDRDRGVDQRDGEAGRRTSRAYRPRGLADEVPVEGEEAGRRGGAGDERGADAAFEESEHGRQEKTAHRVDEARRVSTAARDAVPVDADLAHAHRQDQDRAVAPDLHPQQRPFLLRIAPDAGIEDDVVVVQADSRRGSVVADEEIRSVRGSAVTPTPT